jgi:hypothetical protein
VAGVKNVDNRLKPVPDQIPPTAGAKPLGNSPAATPPQGGLFSKWPVKTAGHQNDGGTGPGSVLPVGGTRAAAIQNNQKVAEQIASALKSARLSGENIEIRYQHGVAALSGTVGDRRQIARAAQVVLRVPGVQAVDNQLTSDEQAAGPASKPRAIDPRAIPVLPVSNRAVMPVAYQAAGGQPAAPGQNGLAPPLGAPGPGGPAISPPPNYGHPGQGAAHTVYDMPHLPQNRAWPSYAHYPNAAQISYPQQYSAGAWPYIGPFYPYPQVPLGWRSAQLEWDDGYWFLNFNPRTDKWFWFMNPKHW